MKTKDLIHTVSKFRTRILCWLRFKTPIPIGTPVVVNATIGDLLALGIKYGPGDVLSGKIYYVTNALRMRRGNWVFTITDPGGYFYPEEFLKIVHQKPTTIT